MICTVIPVIFLGAGVTGMKPLDGYDLEQRLLEYYLRIKKSQPDKPCAYELCHLSKLKSEFEKKVITGGSIPDKLVQKYDECVSLVKNHHNKQFGWNKSYIQSGDKKIPRTFLKVEGSKDGYYDGIYAETNNFNTWRNLKNTNRKIYRSATTVEKWDCDNQKWVKVESASEELIDAIKDWEADTVKRKNWYCNNADAHFYRIDESDWRANKLILGSSEECAEEYIYQAENEVTSLRKSWSVDFESLKMKRHNETFDALRINPVPEPEDFNSYAECEKDRIAESDLKEREKRGYQLFNLRKNYLYTEESLRQLYP